MGFSISIGCALLLFGLPLLPLFTSPTGRMKLCPTAGSDPVVAVLLAFCWAALLLVVSAAALPESLPPQPASARVRTNNKRVGSDDRRNDIMGVPRIFYITRHRRSGSVGENQAGVSINSGSRPPKRHCLMKLMAGIMGR